MLLFTIKYTLLGTAYTDKIDFHPVYGRLQGFGIERDFTTRDSDKMRIMVITLLVLILQSQGLPIELDQRPGFAEILKRNPELTPNVPPDSATIRQIVNSPVFTHSARFRVLQEWNFRGDDLMQVVRMIRDKYNPGNGQRGNLIFHEIEHLLTDDHLMELGLTRRG